MTWLEKLVQQHSELESPKSFWQWAGLCAISAVARDNVWLERGNAGWNLYPNIYVILHADSGLKKGPPVNLAYDLVKRVNNTTIIRGRSSIQGILGKIASSGQTMPGGKIVKKKSIAFICSSELSASLVQDQAALTILTDLYDRNWNEGDYESLLKMEQFQLVDPTLTLFGGINDAHAENLFQKHDVEGGFIGRTFVIYEKQSPVINSLARRLSNPPDKEELSLYLKEIAGLRGPFVNFSDENNNLTRVGRIYDEWYVDIAKQIRQMDEKDRTGTLNRLGDSVCKIAMLLSLSKSPFKEIDQDSMLEAIQLGEGLVGNIRKTTSGKKGLSVSSQLKGLIIKELLERPDHQVTRVMLMKKMWMHYGDATEFDALMLAFNESGMIETTVMGNHLVYRMPPQYVKELSDFLAGKNIKLDEDK